MSGSFQIVSSHNAISNVQCTKQPPKVLSFCFKTLRPSAKSRLLSSTIAYLHKLIPFCCCLFGNSQILFLRSINCTSLFKLIIQYLWVQKSPAMLKAPEAATVSRSVRTQSKRERERKDSDVILKHWNISAAKVSVNTNHPLNHYDPTYSISSYGWNSLSQYESVSSENSIIWMLGIEKSPFLSSHLRKWVYQYVINYLFANKH